MEKILSYFPPGVAWLCLCLVSFQNVAGNLSSDYLDSKLKADFQNNTVRGKITDDAGLSMPGVNILVKGTSAGTTSDANGDYMLAIPGDQSNAILVYSFIGYLPQEIPLNGRSSLNVLLVSDTEQLSEVVVVGYGTQRKKDITGSVASVSTREIGELPITNAQQALQGRVAGVDVVATGTTPGSGVSVRVRGRRSFNAGNDPLYVVDGIPLAGGINDINARDIQSMDVLKDASATAIYGSRGANGVVLITTRRGQPGKTTVSYDGYYGVNSALGRIDVMNGEEFAEYKRESRRATGNYNDADPAAADALLFEPVELESLSLSRSTDYQDLILRTGHQQSHNIGVSGGTDNTTFYFAGSYFNDVGIVPGQDFNRYTFRINLDHKISDRVKIGTSTLVSFNTRNGAGFNPIGGALAENPLGNPYNPDGTLNFLPTTDGLRSNPLSDIVPGAFIREDKRIRILNSIYGEVKIIDGLTYRLNIGPDYQSGRFGEFTGRFTNARRGGDPTARVQHGNALAYTIENVINYNKTIATNHTLNFTGLYSIQRQTNEYYDTRVASVPIEYQEFYNLGNARVIEGIGSNYSQWTIESFMGRVNYAIKDKYLLTFTMRADGSSRFAGGQKYGYFPSVAAGWNIIEENFMTNLPVFTNLKLRASYGQTGNTGIEPYKTLGNLSNTTYAWGNTGAFGYRPNDIANPFLKWETTASTNVGLDFGFFNGRLQGSIDVYRQNTTDLLMNQQLPPTSGTSNVFLSNVGKTQNQGIEIAVSTVNVDLSNGFKWTTDLNFFSNQEKIVELYGGKEDDIGNGWFIGKPLTVFYDYKKVGIWQLDEVDLATQYQRKPGEIKVADLAGRDANGNLVAGPDGKITADDRIILGSDIPDWSGGITNRFSFKGLDLSIFVFARQGGMIRSLFHNQNNNLFGRYNNLDVNYWTPTNPTNEFPRPNQNQEFPVLGSSMSYFDGSFVKIRNITLGYTLPSAITQRIRMQSVRIYASAQNPFIFATYRSKYKGIDPEFARDASNGREQTAEIPAATPSSKLILVGLNIKL